MKLTCKEFWKAALLRALRTLCQTAVATIGTSAVLSEVDWLMVGSASLLAGVLSVLNSIATGLPECGGATEKPPEETPENESAAKVTKEGIELHSRRMVISSKAEKPPEE